MRSAITVLCLWLLSGASPAGAGSRYTFHEIPLGGLSGSQNATGVNDSGVVSGNMITSPDYGFVWALASGVQYFNYGGPAGGEWHAEDINDNGEVTGFYGGPYAWRGHIWKGGSYTDLGQVPGYIETVLLAINNNGIVVGQTWIGAYTMGPPCVGSIASGMSVLDPAFPDDSPAYDINDSGQVVGETKTAGGYDAWWYDSGAAPPVRKTLAHLSGSSSRARGISNAGQIVGVSASVPVLWDGPDGAPQALGTLGGASGVARAVNEHGAAVGESATAAGEMHATLWMNGHVYDLNDLVGLPEGWTVLSAANDINDWGMICGWGWKDGQQRAFALIPEPAALALLAVGGPALVRRRKRRTLP